MEETKHYALQKPAYGDAADVAVLNRNMDLIDDALLALQQGQSAPAALGLAVVDGLLCAEYESEE